MATTPAMLERERSRAWLAAYWLPACTLAMASGVHADVQFEPQLEFAVARTDNLTLASENRQEDTIYELTPSFLLRQDSPRVSSRASYRPEAYWYRDRDTNAVYHVLDGDLSFAPDPDNFFLQLGASREQTIGDLAGPLFNSNLPITNNRLDRDEVYFGPEFMYPLGGDVSVTGRFRRTQIRYDEPEDSTVVAQDLDEDAIGFSLDNYRKERGFTWATRYTSFETQYVFYPSYEYRAAVVELGAWAGRQVRLFASGGKESAWDKPFDPSLEDRVWEVGLATRQDGRVSAEVAAGERSFGSSRRAILTFTFDYGSVILEHSDQPTTPTPDRYGGYSAGPLTPTGFSSGPAGPGQQASPGSSGTEPPSAAPPLDLLTQPSVAERYLSRMSRATINFDWRRTILSVGVFDETREDRLRLDGTPLPDEDQTGLSLSATQRFGARTELVFTIFKNSIGLTAGGEPRDWESISFVTNYDVGSRTRLSLEYEETSDEGIGSEYNARLISLRLTRTFINGVRK